MELIMISDSKLKIMLTTEDMKNYSLDCERMSYDNTETRRAFWSILDEAKHRTGFDAASERVFVQVYPSRSGGCEMYVTKLGLGPNDAARKEEGVKLRYKENYIREEDPKTACEETKEREIYRFSRLSDIAAACKRLCEVGYSAQSAAYSAFGAYYLAVCKTDATELLAEYGESVPTEPFDMYIGEHGNCICAQNATKTLGVFS